MTIRVRLFARARDLAGADLVSLELPAGSSIAEVRKQLTLARPELASLLLQCALALDGEFAQDAQAVGENAEIAVLPPVSGGTEK
jgi:molybdopterin converting factor subunit 1